MGQQDDVSVRKLERVVITIWFTPIDLSERGRLLPDTAREHEPDFASYLVLEGKLGARKQAYGYVPVIHRSKTARDGVLKSGRDQLVADLRGAGCDEL
jgi:hypothetical protein